MDVERADPDPITVVTWNLQGSQGVDTEGIATVIRDAAADVVVIQEIQRRQARRLAEALGMAAMRWAFKHCSSIHPEGLAVFTPHQLLSSDSFVLQGAWFWNWRRRIAVAAEIERGVLRFGIINVHLSPHDAGDRRRREAHLVVERARRSDRLAVIAGDFNDHPGGPGYDVFSGAGWSDAWLLANVESGDGATNWTAGNRSGRAPTQRLDYVFAPPSAVVERAEVLAEAGRHDWFAARSDHLPLVAALRLPDGTPR